jgi:hypothetical protein
VTLPDYRDLLQRTERAKDLLIECALLLGRAARLTFGLPFISPGHWYARKARRLFVDVMGELDDAVRHRRPSITFEQRMLTTKLEIENLLEAVAALSAKLRARVLAG